MSQRDDQLLAQESSKLEAILQRVPLTPLKSLIWTERVNSFECYLVGGWVSFEAGSARQAGEVVADLLSVQCCSRRQVVSGSNPTVRRFLGEL